MISNEESQNCQIMSPTTWGLHTFLVLIITENILRGKKCFEKIFPLTYQAPKLEFI